VDEGERAAEAGDPRIAPGVSILVERDGAAGRPRLARGLDRRVWHRLRQFENHGWRRAAPRGAAALVCLSIRRKSEIVALVCRSIRSRWRGGSGAFRDGIGRLARLRGRDCGGLYPLGRVVWTEARPRSAWVPGGGFATRTAVAWEGDPWTIAKE
jgi:hypothetical protein